MEASTTQVRPQPSRASLIGDFDQLPDGALVDVTALAAYTEQGVSTVWRKVKTDPLHPQPIKLSHRCTRFRVGDIRAYLAAKAAGGAR